MSWIKNWLKSKAKIVAFKRPKHGYEVHTDGERFWKVVTNKDRFDDHIRKLRSKIYGP